MFAEGVFAYSDKSTDNKVDFESIDALVENKSRAVNWTSRLVNEMPQFNKPASSEYNFNSLAKKNRLMWTNDDDDDNTTPNFSGYLIVQNQTIDEKKDLITMPSFQGTKEKNGIAYIDQYATDGTSQSASPRLLTYEIQGGYACGRFSKSGYNLSFSASDGVIARKYQGYQSLITKPRYLKVNCILTDLDLFTLEMDVPVYFEQYGAYYGIIKLQVKKDNLCSCEFLKLPVVEVATELTYDWSSYVCEKTSSGNANVIIATKTQVQNWYDKILLQSQYPVTSDVYVAVRFSRNSGIYFAAKTNVCYVAKIPAGSSSVEFNIADYGQLISFSLFDIATTMDGMPFIQGNQYLGEQPSSFQSLTGPDSDATYVYAISAIRTNTGYKRYTGIVISDGTTYFIGDPFDNYAAVSNTYLASLSQTNYETRLNDWIDMIEQDYTSITIDRAKYRELNTTDCPLN